MTYSKVASVAQLNVCRYLAVPESSFPFLTRHSGLGPRELDSSQTRTKWHPLLLVPVPRECRQGID